MRQIASHSVTLHCHCRRSVFGAWVGAALLLALTAGCGTRHATLPENAGGEARSKTVVVAKGVTYRYFPEGDAPVSGTSSDALVLDVDLRQPNVRARVAAEHPARERGLTFADAYTVRDWCARQHALAGINGGFFGETRGERKQPLGLLVTEGSVQIPGRKTRSPSHPDRQYVRCALGFTMQGRPRIGWVTSEQDTLLSHDRPLNPTSRRRWKVASAVACGPRLIAAGQREITDKQERLGDARALPRTFVAYDVEGTGAGARPHHLLLGIAMQMTYADVATFVQRYFDQTYHTHCIEAMCLDGGSSSQLVYRAPKTDAGTPPDGYVETRPAFVTVPTAILVEGVEHLR